MGPHGFRNAALFKKRVVSACGCCRLSGPFAPSIKSLPSGKEILLFECGDRTSYKISRLEVIFMGPWAGALFRPFSGARKRAFQAPLPGQALCLGQGLAKYGASAIGNNLLRILAQKASRARACPPFSTPDSATSLSHTVSARPQYTKRAPALSRKPLQLNSLFGKKIIFRRARCSQILPAFSYRCASWATLPHSAPTGTCGPKILLCAFGRAFSVRQSHCRLCR